MSAHQFIVCFGESQADGIIEYFFHFNILVLLVYNIGRVYRWYATDGRRFEVECIRIGSDDQRNNHCSNGDRREEVTRNCWWGPIGERHQYAMFSVATALAIKNRCGLVDGVARWEGLRASNAHVYAFRNGGALGRRKWSSWLLSFWRVRAVTQPMQNIARLNNQPYLPDSILLGCKALSTSLRAR